MSATLHLPKRLLVTKCSSHRVSLRSLRKVNPKNRRIGIHVRLFNVHRYVMMQGDASVVST